MFDYVAALKNAKVFSCVRDVIYFMLSINVRWGTRWYSWLRHCATSRKVTGSIPDGVTGIFH